MLVASHLAAGAAIGMAVERPWPRTLAALGTHLVLDGVGHDDETVSPLGQALLGVAALGALAVCWGPTSSVVLGALAGAVPDTEVAADLALFARRGGGRPGSARSHALGGSPPANRVARYGFPSHWQIGEREKPAHPYRFPGPAIPVRLEMAIAAGVLAAICAAGLRRRHAAA